MIGVLGVGHLGRILVQALVAAGHGDLIMSPRGKSGGLGLRVGVDNAEVVALSDVVLLAVRPRDAVAAVTGLPWRRGQVLVSACAGVTVAALRAGLPEGVAVHRIMPVTAAAQGASPTVVYPPVALDWLGAFGPVLAVETEAQFETATVCAAVYGWMQRLIEVTADWSVGQGLPEGTARSLAALTAVAAGRNIAGSDVPMAQLLAELVTPGGITERGLQVLGDAGAMEGWVAACDAVALRLSGR